jgi:hypothetical protein
LGIEGQPCGQLVLELVALAKDAFDCVFRRFCANLSNISKINLPVKPAKATPVQKPAQRKNINHQPAQTAPEPLRLTGVSSWVLQ